MNEVALFLQLKNNRPDSEWQNVIWNPFPPRFPQWTPKALENLICEIGIITVSTHGLLVKMNQSPQPKDLEWDLAYHKLNVAAATIIFW